MFLFWNLFKKKFSKARYQKGDRAFSLVEVIVGSAIFMIISMAVYQSYAGLLNVVRVSRVKITAANLANEQFEIIKNLPYADVGLVAGVPLGVIPANQTLIRDGITFDVDAFVRNTDDPFDGTIGGSPNDLSPADYKLVEMRISCATCQNFSPMIFTGRVAPKNLEAASTNGSLFVRAFDKNGDPIPQAEVHIVNNSVAPAVDINEETNNDGVFQLVDTIPSVDSYQITVTKPGFSTDKTYAVGGAEVQNPSKPHSTVALQQVTQTSFQIDQVSAINLSTLRSNCAVVPNVDFSIAGTKTIGTTGGTPVLKYSSNQTTDGSGARALSNLEWDTYNISLNDPSYDLAGTISPLPVTLQPGGTQDVVLVATNKNPRSILMTIKDAATSLPVTNASVNLTNTSGYDQTKITNQGFLSQTEWQGGGGQNNFASDSTKYFSSDGNIEDNSPAGELKLKEIFGLYQTHGELISSTFDIGASGPTSNFHQIVWSPTNQPAGAGSPTVRFQIASNSTNTGGETWTFKGPDGTSGTYYTLGDQDIADTHNGDRYFRYKLLLDTADNTVSPSISDISFTFTSACVPPGQVIFEGLSAGNYSYTVSKTGYQDSNGTVNANTNWQNVDIIFQPD